MRIKTNAIPTLALTIAGLVGGLTACGSKDDKKQNANGEEQSVEVTEEEIAFGKTLGVIKLDKEYNDLFALVDERSTGADFFLVSATSKSEITITHK